jgi:NAD(P)-dependent dehydrogenase (short-subunit alcohol dehydrogenase family)
MTFRGASLALILGQERAEAAIKSIQGSSCQAENPGVLIFLPFDLNDLDSVRAAAATFQRKETRLDVLWNNAGCGPMRVKPGQRTVQGFEPMIGMHLVATLLFCRLLRPQLRAAVTLSAPGAVRVIWVTSIALEGTPRNGIEFEHLQDGKDLHYNYGASKVGSWFLSREMAHRWSEDGIVVVALNPGNVKGNSYENMGLRMLVIGPILHETKFGAYTELYAGLSNEITLKHSGGYIIPWGRLQADEEAYRQDIITAMKPIEQGGLGYARKLWEWCEDKAQMSV